MTSSLWTLADEVHDTLAALSPVEASLWGDHRFDSEVPDVSPDALASARRTLDEVSDRVTASGSPPTTTDDAVTCDVALHAIAHARHELDDRYVRSAVGPMTSGAGIGSAASALLGGLPKLVVANDEQADAYLQRCGRIPGSLASAEDQLRAGVAEGCVPPARLVAATVRQIDRYLDIAAAADPLVLPPPVGRRDPDGWRAACGEIIATVVRPALRRHRTVLAEEIAPAARPDDAVGLLHLPDGDRLYAEAVALHTTTDDSPQMYHELGLELIADLADEYRELGGRVVGTTRLDEIFAHLRDSPALRFMSADEIHATAVASLRRAQLALPDWFDSDGSIPCEVRPIPLLEAPESTLGYYQPPALDGHRPGIYYVNTTEPQVRTRFEAEVLAFHESVPGHHTQIATAMGLDLPKLRRLQYLTAYAEGWGLYVERLADEMGLYSDDLSRLGMLSFDSWRACRLVVDTGMHALGWSRDRAMAFMRANSPQSPRNIANEIDRYVGWPGQALAYMAGRTRIVGARERARRALGARFDIAAFHRVVLGHAAVPLGTLDRLVDAWVAAAA